ncbi:MAG: hypothetical protein HYY46_02245 [Deltaproteobacteria bacterium]|nr:hypothetical protein [Deltaproteobacteria bacterium]
MLFFQLLRRLSGLGFRCRYGGQACLWRAPLVDPELNFSRLAQCFGIFGQRVEQPEEIAPALERALQEPGPAVIDVIISQKTRKD